VNFYVTIRDEALNLRTRVIAEHGDEHAVEPLAVEFSG
jgi:hypothetical protein